MNRSGERVAPVLGESLGRRQFLRGMAVTGAAASAGGLLTACSGSSSPAIETASSRPRYGGNLSVGMAGGSSSDTLDPHQGRTYVDTGRSEALYEPLVKLDKQAKNEFVLAESITPHNGSLSEWVIQLRPGVTFHSGKSLEADDVIYTMRRIISNDFSGTVFLGPVDLKGVKALDKLTVLVPMRSPFASFVDQLAGGWYYLYIVPDGWKGGTPNGTGPFAYQSFTPGQRSVFVKNKNYWQHGLPYLDAVAFIDFSENSAVQDAMTTGAIQAAGQLDPAQVPALANAHGVTPVTSRTGQFKPFTMRVDRAPFHDVNVRQAMRLLVDRQQMIDSALDGYGIVASDVFAPYDPDFDHSLHRQQDVPQAKFLLKKAGFDDDLHVTLTTSAIATGTVAMATVLAEQAMTAGVTIKVQTVDPHTFFAKGKYLNWTFSQDYYSYAAYLNQAAQSFLPHAPFNGTHTDNAHYTSLYRQANATADASARKQIEHEMQHFDFAHGAYIIPTFMDSLDAYSDRLRGYTTSTVGEPLSNWDFNRFWFAS